MDSASTAKQNGIFASSNPGTEHKSLVSCQQGSLSLVPCYYLPPFLRYCFVLCLVLQSCPTLCNPIDCSTPRLLCPWGFFRQKYWSGLPFPPPGDLPNPKIKPRSSTLQEDFFFFFNHQRHQGSLRILEWVAYTFSMGSS